MQVIHRYNGAYPFSLDSDSSHTFLEVVKQNLTQQQIAQYRTKYKIIKTLDHTHLIKLVKIYKEQCSLHLLYEYYPYSIEHYLQYLSQHTQKKDKNAVKFAHSAFIENMTRIVQVLVQFQIRTDIFIQNFALEDPNSFHLKLFMDPQSQFLQLEQQNQNDQDVMEANYNKNKEILHQFYNAEKQRLLIEFQEILEKYFGKINEVSQSNRPNFVINGSKLVFIGGQQKNNEKEHKNSINSQISNQQVTKKKELSRSPAKFQRPEAKQNLKQKNMKKIEQIKNVLTKLQNKNYNPLHQNHHRSEQPKHYHQQDIDFRPEQIQTDKTAILEENQYLQCLQNQLANMNQTSPKKQRSSQEKRSQLLKQIDKIQEKSKDSFHYKDKVDEKKGYKIESNMSTEVNNKSEDRGNKKIDRFNNSDEIGMKTEEKKSNKYKMKITTSHQIQIEGKGEPEIREAENQILQGIKNGKINLPSFNQRPKTVKIETQEIEKPSKEATKPISVTQDLRMNSRNSDIASKSKKINEIIQKIQSRANINQQLSNSSHQNENKTDNHQNHNVIKSNVNSQHQHFSQNYLDKIRQAKQKAEHVLKQYAKKKQ